MLDRSLAVDLDTALAWEALGQGSLIESEDHREGLAAFFAKRSPNFRGR
jgi:2-(1,2-epoxy-1,2-dihydrophenyl)acetyl-CoA isomerase